MKEDIERALDDIFYFDTAVILESLLRVLGPEDIINLRRSLRPKWYDGIWWPYDTMQPTINMCFKFGQKITRISRGNYTDGEEYEVNTYVCRLCGEIVEEEDRFRHIENYCKVSKEIYDTCKSLVNFKERLLMECKL
jgi:hypothetical protein